MAVLEVSSLGQIITYIKLICCGGLTAKEKLNKSLGWIYVFYMYIKIVFENQCQ